MVNSRPQLAVTPCLLLRGAKQWANWLWPWRQRPWRAAYDQAAQPRDLSGRGGRAVQHDCRGSGTVAAECFWHAHVNFGRVKIPQLEQAEGGLMRHRGHRLFIASSRPEQPGHHLPVLWRRKMFHPVDDTAE